VKNSNSGELNAARRLKERRQREKQAKQEEILKAAIELFSKKGINGAPMNHIANKDELGGATLYS